MDAGFIPALPFHHGYLEPDCVERRGGVLMCGMKIPLHDFALKMRGGGGLMREGGRICRTLRYYSADFVLPKPNCYLDGEQCHRSYQLLVYSLLVMSSLLLLEY